MAYGETAIIYYRYGHYLSHDDDSRNKATDTIFDYDFQKKTAIVMGSEESGMRHLTREKCDAIVKIPMAKGVESLNVSVAAGIAMYEVVRQFLAK